MVPCQRVAIRQLHGRQARPLTGAAERLARDTYPGRPMRDALVASFDGRLRDALRHAIRWRMSGESSIGALLATAPPLLGLEPPAKPGQFNSQLMIVPLCIIRRIIVVCLSDLPHMEVGSFGYSVIEARPSLTWPAPDLGRVFFCRL